MVEVVRESAASGKHGAPAQFAGGKAILEEEPSDPEVLALAEPRPIAEHFWYGVSRGAQMIARGRLELSVAGLDRIQQRGPVIVGSNHQRLLDLAIMECLL